MSDYAPKVLKYILLDNADATISQVGEQQVCRDYSWSISWFITGTIPSDKFEVIAEYSNDGIVWDLLTACTIIDNKTKGAFFHSVLPFLNLRISYRAVRVAPGAIINSLLILKPTT